MIDSKDLRVLDSSELRIGNLVLDSTKNTTKIESIIPEHNRVRYGIKLTEHWLERFGFEKEAGSFMGLQICNSWTFIYWSEYHGLELSVNEYGVKFTNIKYVHQLQNLFYSLTGKELELTKQ